MWDVLNNPFKKGGQAAPRKSAQKELSEQKDAPAKAKAQAPKAVAPKKAQPKKDSAKGRNLAAGFGIILKPLVSEKTARQGANDTYAFVVARGTNKVEIKKAFQKMYGVAPVSVQIANVAARATNFRRVPGARSAWKKAYIRVPKGSTISVYEGV